MTSKSIPARERTESRSPTWDAKTVEGKPSPAERKM